MQENTKRKRQALLRDVLAGEHIGDQESLLAALKKRGLRTTQATISRDFRELGVIKAPAGPDVYAYRIAAPDAQAASQGRKLDLLFRNFVTDVKGASNLVVIKTTPGNANGVASSIDARRRPHILGTLAGDDTILVVVDSESHRAEAEREFRALLQGA